MDTLTGSKVNRNRKIKLNLNCNMPMLSRRTARDATLTALAPLGALIKLQAAGSRKKFEIRAGEWSSGKHRGVVSPELAREIGPADIQVNLSFVSKPNLQTGFL
jgi:hypothetical protein